MSKQMDKLTKAYRKAINNASPTSAYLINEGEYVKVVSTWSQPNIDRNITAVSQMFHLFNKSNNECTTIGSTEITGEIMGRYSPTGLYKGLFRETPAAGKTPKKQFLEVWKSNILHKVFDLTSADLHGDIHSDNDFSCFEWSQCEEQILYVAEKKIPKSESFFSLKKSGDKEKLIKGNEYEFIDEWGDQLVGKSFPSLFIADLTREEIRGIETDIPDGLCLGQGQWAPDGKGMVGVAWDTRPRRLGLVYCNNRPSWIFYLTSDGVFKKLSGDGVSVRSPCFSPDKSKLLWVERKLGGPHQSVQKIIKYNWDSEKVETIIDEVNDSIKCTGGEDFFGLYNVTLKNCWLSDNKTIVISTIQRASFKTYTINTDGYNEITEIGKGGQEETLSQVVLNVSGNLVVCSVSSFLSSPGLVIGNIVANEPVEWISLVETTNILDGYQVKVIHMEADHSHEVNKYCYIYFGPKSGENIPLIVQPHGGPHSAVPNFNNSELNFFCSLGFAMIFINYRGSIGAGQDNLNYLLGKIGDIDVDDTHQSCLHALKTFTFLDPNKVLLLGGSHGGFLVLHLATRFSNTYRSVVTRNPVVNLTRFGDSDIPDWVFTEGGSVYSYKGMITSELFQSFLNASPINKVADVKIPILFLLGRKDLRVPCNQGLEFYYALKANNIKTKCLMYDDNHLIRQVAYSADCAINSVLWFLESIDHNID